MRRLLAAVLPLALAFGAASWWMLLRPGPEPPPSDAVVVLAGGGQCIRTGVQLVERGHSPTLIVSDGGEVGWEEVERLCASHPSYQVVCFTPQPANTRGEARAIAALADELNVDSLILVTVPTHRLRARVLLQRCTDLRISTVAAPADENWLGTARAVVHEWAGLLEATVDRGC